MSLKFFLGKNLFFLLVFLMNTQVLMPKECDIKNRFNLFNKSIQQLVIPDSLQKTPYKKLEELFNLSVTDSAKSSIYASTYLAKAKKEFNLLETANGYYLFCRCTNDPKIILKYADSIISITKNHDYKKYPTRGYLEKGYALLTLNQFNESLEAYIKGLELAESKNDYPNYIAFKHNIALLKNILGKDKEALKEYKENLKFIKKQDTTLITYRSQYITTLFKISETLNNLEALDSANYYLKTAIIASSSGKRHRYYPAILLSHGINSYKRQEYHVSLDSLLKAEKLLSDKEKVYTYLGKGLLKLKRQEEAIIYFKKVDSMTNQVNNYYPETREALNLLKTHYVKINDKNNQLRLLKKLIKLDSISNIQFGKLNNNIVKNYDTTRLIQEKDNLIEKIKDKSMKVLFYLSALVIIFMACIVLLYQYLSKKKKQEYERKFQEKLSDIKLKKNDNKKSKDLELSSEQINEILKKLRKFEDRNEFLTKDITLNKVAKKIKTNSTYLSKVINSEKQKNFANYLNDLRINFCLKELKNDRKLRSYSIQAIANEMGFNSVRSFSAAFYKKTGRHPSSYIKNLFINDL